MEQNINLLYGIQQNNNSKEIDNMNMNFETQIINNTKEDVIEYLKGIAEYDLDFCGENGEDYLWDKAREQGFESNSDYCINEVMEQYGKDRVKAIEEYFELWLGSDGYYDEYHYSVNKYRNKLFISFAYIGSC